MTFEDKTKLCNDIHSFYQVDKNGAGGTLHIVLDDGNLDNHSIQWCIENSIKEKNDEEALRIANELLKLSFSARKKLYGNYWKTTEEIK